MATAKKTEKGVLPEPVEPTPDPTITPPEPTYEPPEKYREKSLEDIITMHQEAEKKIGSMGDELGKERKERERAQGDLNYLQQWYQTQQPKPQGQEPDIPQTQFDYDNPVQSVDQIVERKLKGWTEEQKKQQRKMEQQEATQNYFRGRSIAFQKDKNLHEGIERDVEGVVWNAYLNGAVSKLDLSDPMTWEDAAWIVHKKRGNYDRLVPPKPKPMAPTATDTPGGIKPPSMEPPSEALEFDSHAEEMLKLAEKSGFKRDEFIKEVKGRRKQFGPSREGE